MASWQWGVGSSSGLIRSWKGVSAAEGSVPWAPSCLSVVSPALGPHRPLPPVPDLENQQRRMGEWSQAR